MQKVQIVTANIKPTNSLSIGTNFYCLLLCSCRWTCKASRATRGITQLPTAFNLCTSKLDAEGASHWDTGILPESFHLALASRCMSSGAIRFKSWAGSKLF